MFFSNDILNLEDPVTFARRLIDHLGLSGIADNSNGRAPFAIFLADYSELEWVEAPLGGRAEGFAAQFTDPSGAPCPTGGQLQVTRDLRRDSKCRIADYSRGARMRDTLAVLSRAQPSRAPGRASGVPDLPRRPTMVGALPLVRLVQAG